MSSYNPPPPLDLLGALQDAVETPASPVLLDKLVRRPTGCPAAIEAARRYREAREPPAECRLAHELHLVPGFRCRRAGGRSVCGACVGDVWPTPELPINDERASPDGVKPVLATEQPSRGSTAPQRHDIAYLSR